MQKNLRSFSSSLRFLLILLLCAISGAASAQISVTATGGTLGPTAYTTLKSAFDAINAGTHTGAITISVTGSTTESATAVLNGNGNGSASFSSVLIKPGTGSSPTISGSLTSTPLIKLNGASNVKFDGSNNGTTSRDMTITNSATTGAYVFWIGSVGTAVITTDTVKNCIVTEGAATAVAILTGDAGTLGNPGYFNNLGFQNNSIQRAFIGFYMYAVLSGTNGSGTSIALNDLSTSGSMANRRYGIYMFGTNGITVANNTIGNFEAVNAESDRGIYIDAYNTGTVVTGNTITNLGYTGTLAYAAGGIDIQPYTTGANITVTGNTITNISSAGTLNALGITFSSPASGLTISKNQISNIKNTNTTGYGAAGIYLASTSTAAAVDVTNNFVSDIAAYGTNLWTASSNGNGIVADAGGGYNIYYNSVLINTNETANTGTRSAAVLITSNITTANSINLRNNLLINTQTVGNANSRLALAVTAPTTVFNTFNYNDYYSASGNLAGQGTNPTIWNTIAQIQTNMGLNANSVSILPVFTSATDLHLPTASNATLNNTGVSIAAITDDIDGNARTSTPDMGADEFGNCSTTTITAQPANVQQCDSLTATFTSGGTNATVFQWQVNTGSGFTNITNGGVYSGATTGTLSIVPATASMSGYTYRLQASSGASCTQVASNSATLTVNPKPSVVLTVAGAIAFCTGDSVLLSVPSGANLTYVWKNGTTVITGATGNSYAAKVTGSFSVTVTNSVTFCTATSNPVAVTVGAGPVSVISPSGTIAICQGTSTTLSAGNATGVTYQWKLNGNNITGATNATYSASAAGSYTVVVSTGPFCNTTSAATVITINPLPTATDTSIGLPIICQGNTVTLNANTGTGLTYQWLLNGANISGATSSGYTAATAGVYRVQVTNSATSCKDTSTPITVVVNALPAATITPANPVPICEGDTSLLTANTGAGLTYQWMLNTANVAGATAGTYKAFVAGSYIVLVTNANGCQKTSAGVTVTVNPVPPAIVTYNSPLAFCDGGAIVLNAYPGPGLNYQWLKDGNIMAGITTPNNIVSQTGQYSVRVTNSFNCVGISPAVSVTVFPTPVPAIGFSNSVLNTGSFNTYQWYLNNVPINSGTHQTDTPKVNGAYKVRVMDANGCVGTSQIFFLNNLAVGGVAGDKIAMLVYPNPAGSSVTIENQSRTQLTSVSILNSIGSLISERSAGGKDKIILELNDLANGIYYLRIATDGGVVLRKLEILK